MSKPTRPTAFTHAAPPLARSGAQMAQAVPSETLQMEPAARDNQQSMALKKIVAKLRVRSSNDSMGLSEHLPILLKHSGS